MRTYKTATLEQFLRRPAPGEQRCYTYGSASELENLVEQWEKCGGEYYSTHSLSDMKANPSYYVLCASWNGYMTSYTRGWFPESAPFYEVVLETPEYVAVEDLL